MGKRRNVTQSTWFGIFRWCLYAVRAQVRVFLSLFLHAVPSYAGLWAFMFTFLRAFRAHVLWWLCLFLSAVRSNVRALLFLFLCAVRLTVDYCSHCFWCAPFLFTSIISLVSVCGPEYVVARLPELWDRKMWSYFPRDQEPRMTVLARAGSNSLEPNRITCGPPSYISTVVVRF